MIKVSYLQGVAFGLEQAVFPLFHSSSADKEFEKKAESVIMPDVAKYIAALKPLPGCQYSLVNAMGAGEFYGSNINADWFDETGLIHCPDGWTGVPDIDKLKSKDWPYGFPTFYNAGVFAHHRNKNHDRRYGDVELSVWNDRMKRVELVLRVDKTRCDQFGGTGVWDKLKLGQYPDVSMGSKVPWDLCSICTDWQLYKEALATFDPKKHKSPGEAVLQFHKAKRAKDGLGIRGLSITRADYCEHMRKMPNRILPDGRKVFVHNPFPRFFDISYVFIGADKTAKQMMKIASDERVWFLPSAELAEKLGYVDWTDGGLEKAASVEDDILKTAFLGKSAKLKRGEIEKHGPTQFDSKAIPVLTKGEPSLSKGEIDDLCEHPLDSILSSTGAMGIPLRPREFQRIVIIKMGLRPIADDLDSKNVVFPKVDTPSRISLSPESVVPRIVEMLGSLFGSRSALSPALDRRITVVVRKPGSTQEKSASSLPMTLLHKIGSAYSGYRQSLMNYWSEDRRDQLEKTASSVTALTHEYLKHAYWNEVGRL